MSLWGRSAGHPALLPWYVAGTLSGRESRRVRAHVERCRDCRERVGELSAQRAHLLGVTRSDHPQVEELVAFVEPAPPLPAERCETIALHLAGCPACAHEHALLADAAERSAAIELTEPSSPRSGAVVPWGRLAAAAAAPIVLVMAGFLAGRTPLEAPPKTLPAPGLRPIIAVTFVPAHRGEGRAPELALPGPWAVTVVLPFGAPATPYRSGIWTSAGTQVASGAEASVADPEGNLHLYVEPLPAAGEYVLVLEPGEPGAEAARYPFRVVAGDAPPVGE